MAKLSLEDAARVVLKGGDGRPREDGTEKPAPKITLPRLRFLERPMPEWEEPPPPKKKGMRK